MELTKEQIKFLDKVCRGTWALNSNDEVDVDGYVTMVGMDLTEIPVKFGNVNVKFGNINISFDCSYNKLTTLKNTPNKLIENAHYSKINIEGNDLKEYFKSIKEEDFQLWDKLFWSDVLDEYPFLINIGKKYIDKRFFKGILNHNHITKLYLE